MTDKDAERERSEFSGEFTEDGITVVLDIFRTPGSQDSWSMEVIDQEAGSTVWEEPFATDMEAFEEFLATIQRDGIGAFCDDPDPGSAVQ
ncbi:MAG: hypothetical protein ACOH2J_10500 [Allorhizobium sp.]